MTTSHVRFISLLVDGSRITVQVDQISAVGRVPGTLEGGPKVLLNNGTQIPLDKKQAAQLQDFLESLYSPMIEYESPPGVADGHIRSIMNAMKQYRDTVSNPSRSAVMPPTDEPVIVSEDGGVEGRGY